MTTKWGASGSYIDFEEPLPCPKCELGILHFSYGGETGYMAECDKCDHSYSLVVGEA